MATTNITHILGLLLVAVVAVLLIGLLMYLGERPRSGDMPVLGFPPERYPAQDLTRGGPLVELATTQARLTLMALQLPPQSDQRIWLRTFLIELRAIMDAAYRVALMAQLYEQPAALARLSAEVRQIELDVAAQVTQLAACGGPHDDLLDGRLAALRLCARELSGLAPAHSSGA